MAKGETVWADFYFWNSTVEDTLTRYEVAVMEFQVLEIDNGCTKRYIWTESWSLIFNTPQN